MALSIKHYVAHARLICGQSIFFICLVYLYDHAIKKTGCWCLAGQTNLTLKNRILTPSGNVVDPSGNLPPVIWATNNVSSGFRLTLMRFIWTSIPRILETTFAVSWWPMQLVNPEESSLATTSGSTGSTETREPETGNIWMENALLKYLIRSPP